MTTAEMSNAVVDSLIRTLWQPVVRKSRQVYKSLRRKGVPVDENEVESDMLLYLCNAARKMVADGTVENMRGCLYRMRHGWAVNVFKAKVRWWRRHRHLYARLDDLVAAEEAGEEVTVLAVGGDDVSMEYRIAEAGLGEVIANVSHPSERQRRQARRRLREWAA